jgi:hypothetical protein
MTEQHTSDHEEAVAGLGKFEGERKAVVYAYEASLDGWADTFGDSETFGFYAYVDLGEPIGVVCFVQNSQGFVSEISESEFNAAQVEWEDLGEESGK